ncbi:hypothetical protein D3C78_1417860 [compost metagenome]
MGAEEVAGVLTGGLLSKPLDGAGAAVGVATGALPPVKAARESLPKAGLVLVAATLIKASSLPTLCSACLTLVISCSLVNGLLT